MMLTPRINDAVLAMIIIAENKDRPVSLVVLSDVLGVSRSHLEQTLSLLRKYGLISGTRGPQGGYKLISSPNEIKVSQIVAAVGEIKNIYRKECKRTNHEIGPVEDMWIQLERKEMEFLGLINLASLIANRVE